MNHLSLCLVLGIFFYTGSQSSASAEESRKGTSLCTFGDCSLKDLPVGVVKKVESSQIRVLSSPNVGKPPTLESLKIRKQDRVSARIVAHNAERVEVSGNLPTFYKSVDRSDYRSSEGNIYNVPHNVGESLKGLKAGDMIHAVIEQSIKASPSVPTPIRALIMSGQYRGSYLLGSATLDRELKRVLIQFIKLRRVDTDQVFQLKASGLSLSGQIGLEGRYESNNGRFFVGELLSATAAGFLDATTQRSQNSLGNYVQEPSVSNAGKQGAVQALSRSADRFAEEARSHPESTEVDGYQEIQVLVEESPTETHV